VRKLKRGSSKHKGKLLFMCFNCGGVGNFVVKFSYEKREDSDDEDNNVKEYHNNRKNIIEEKNILRRKFLL
jgi:hypothetical protein